MQTSPAAGTTPPAPLPPAGGGRRDEAHRTLRNAGVVMASRSLHLVAATLFAVFVPRLLGPPAFGRYAVLTSVSEWFAQLSGMGALSIVTRVVPQLMAGGQRAETDKLFTNLFVLRVGTAAVSAGAYAIIVLVWLDEPDLVSALLVAAGLPARILGNLCFGLFLGRNETVRWSLGDLLQRWLLLVFVLAGAAAGGLRGACTGYFLAGVVSLLVGMAGAREALRWPLLDLSARYLRPYLRIGMSFAVGQVLHVIALRSGAVIVRLATGSYVQVGYFGAALAIYQTGGHAMWQVALSFAPFFVGRFHAGERRAVAGWLERLLALLVIGAVVVNLAVLFVGADLVSWLLGEAYAPVAASLGPLAAGLVPFAFAAVGRLVALIVDRPGVAAIASALELAVVWIAGLALSASFGSPGAAAGMLIGICGWAAALFWPLRRELTVPVGRAAKALALGGALVPLALLRGAPAANVLLLLVSAALYLVLAVRFGIVSPRDIETLRQLTRRRAATVVTLDDD